MFSNARFSETSRSAAFELPHGVVSEDQRCSRAPAATKPPHIVDDLIPLFLEGHENWWPRDLLRLALVSLAWVGPIRRLLYAYPRLQSYKSCTLFARTLSGNTNLSPLIQGLDLCPAFTEDGLTEEDMASLRFVLNLKGLRSMTLGGQLAMQAERFIQMMGSTHTISSLHIDGSYISQSCGSTSLWRPASLRWDDSVAFRFARSLRTLRLSNIQLSIADADISYALRIRSLILFGGRLNRVYPGPWQQLFQHHEQQSKVGTAYFRSAGASLSRRQASQRTTD